MLANPVNPRHDLFRCLPLALLPQLVSICEKLVEGSRVEPDCIGQLFGEVVEGLLRSYYAEAVSRGPGPLSPPKGFLGRLQLALVMLLNGPSLSRK